MVHSMEFIPFTNLEWSAEHCALQVFITQSRLSSISWGISQEACIQEKHSSFGGPPLFLPWRPFPPSSGQTSEQLSALQARRARWSLLPPRPAEAIAISEKSLINFIFWIYELLVWFSSFLCKSSKYWHTEKTTTDVKSSKIEYKVESSTVYNILYILPIHRKASWTWRPSSRISHCICHIDYVTKTMSHSIKTIWYDDTKCLIIGIFRSI